ncbi:MAG: hypothetical protein EOO61_01330 [Hymenobacter sp.]|nr:MAG: hypothetical protein EOO61_01330 [Hymenobacter sp.]
MPFIEFTLPSGVATVVNTDQIVSMGKDRTPRPGKDSLLEYAITLSDGSKVELTKEDYDGLCKVVGATDLATIAAGKNMDRILNR